MKLTRSSKPACRLLPYAFFFSVSAVAFTGCSKKSPDKVEPAVHVEFTYNLVKDVIPGQVKCVFANKSTGADSFEWEIGGEKITTVEPEVWFYKAGHYKVNLTARKGDKSEVFSKDIEITTDHSLLVYYPFSGTAVDKVNGTAANTRNVLMAPDRKGAKDGCYSFNGTSAYIKLPEALIKNTKSAATISLWYKADAPVQVGGLFGYQDAEVGGTTVDYVPAAYVGVNKGLHAKFWFGTAAMAEDIEMDNNWHHLVLTGDEAGQAMYLDGIVVEESSHQVLHDGAMKFNQLGVAYCGGGWPNSPDVDGWYYFKGKLDDIRIYNRRINAKEVLALKNE